MIDKISSSIIPILENTNLSEKQKHAYAALLTLGQATVTDIARLAELKRPITYVVLDELVEKGFAQRQPGAGQKFYSATDPNRLISDMRSQLHELEEMLPHLKAIQKRGSKPYVQYFEGESGAKQAFAQIYKPKEARYAFSIPIVSRAIPSEFKRWTKLYATKKSGLDGKHLLKVRNKKSDYVTTLRKGDQEVRFLPEDTPFDVDVAIVDGSVYITGFDDEVNVTVIHSQAIHDIFARVYDAMWSKSSD